MRMGHGKILVIAEDAWARDTIRVLLGSMGSKCVMTTSAADALAALDQETPDAAIVDAQRATTVTLGRFSALDEICQGLRGRVIVLTGECDDPEVTALTERYDLTRVRRERLVQDLWHTLDSLLRPNSLFRRVMHPARLIFDSFLQPSPVGIRDLQPAGRRFIYQAGTFMVDVSLEPSLTGSRRISLVGQLLNSTEPDRQSDVHAVTLRSKKGPTGVGATGKFGEFQFEFDPEPNVELEIETATNQWISVVLPRMERLEKGAGGAA